MRTHHYKFLRSKLLPRSLRRIGTLLGIVWALPMTMLGVLFALPIYLCHGKAELVKGSTVAILVSGPFGEQMLSHHPFGVMIAMALGHIVITGPQGLPSRILVHELVHVRQAARWGPVFPFAYLASSAWAVLRGQDAYWHNAFEIAAREAEKHVGREQAFLD
jgi:hypothetical protein